jgi:hypothetical protein
VLGIGGEERESRAGKYIRGQNEHIHPPASAKVGRKFLRVNIAKWVQKLRECWKGWREGSFFRQWTRGVGKDIVLLMRNKY